MASILPWAVLKLPGYMPFLLFILLAYVVVTAVRRRYFSPISDIPGPFSASVSIFWQTWQIAKGHTAESTIKLHEQYGPFVRISPKEVSINHPDAIRAVLLAPLRKGEFYGIMALPDHHHPTPMSERDPKRCVQRKKNVASGYALSNIMASQKFIDDTIGLLEERLDQLSQANEPVAFDRWFNFMAFDIIGEVTFSRRFGFLDKGIDIGGAIANTRVLTAYVSVMAHFQWLHRLTLGNPIINYLGLQPNQHIFDTAKAAVAARQVYEFARTDMIEQWKISRRNHPDRMAEQEIQDVATANIGAGADTISTTLQAFFYFLLKHPEHLVRLRGEIDAANARGELSHVVSYAEAQKLPFLQACIKETFRCHPAVSTGLPRITPEEGLVVAGHRFERGITVSVNAWAIHRNPLCFGKTAAHYDPTRWLDPDQASRMDKYMIQFGAGYNSCPGRNLAYLEVNKVTATLVRDFDVRQVEPGREWRYEEWFTAVPYGWDCWVRRRVEKGVVGVLGGRRLGEVGEMESRLRCGAGEGEGI